MFDKKEKKQQQKFSSKSDGAEEKIAANVTTIPQEFFGGANPVVYPKQSEAKEKKNIQVDATTTDGSVAGTPSARHMAMSVNDAQQALNAMKADAPQSKVEKEKKLPEKGTGVRAAKPAPKKSKSPFVFVGVFIVVLAILGGASWYYLFREQPQQQNTFVTLPPAPAVTPPPPPPPPAVTTTIPTPPEPVEPPVPTTTPGLNPTALRFPRILLADSTDLDVDSLTDEEEALFGTDVGIWDSDNDGYYDGQEVFNLYNPSGFAPVRLIDSGLIRDYAHPQWKYRIYYPITWEVATLGEDEKQALFSSITGDFIEVRVMEKDANETFEMWFTRSTQDQLFTDLQPFENRFEETGMKRHDDLVAYFPTDTHVFILIYNPGVIDSIPYRHVMQMMYQSFRPGRNITVLPEQPVIPAPPTTPPQIPLPVISSTSTTSTEPQSSPTSTQDSAFATGTAPTSFGGIN